MKIASALRDDIIAAEDTALSLGRYDDVVDLFWPLYMSQVLSGDHRQAIPSLREALAIDGGLDTHHEARALGLLLSCLVSGNRQEDALALADRALDVTRGLAELGMPEPLQSVLTTLANATSFAGREGASDLARSTSTTSRPWSSTPLRSADPTTLADPTSRGGRHRLLDALRRAHLLDAACCG